MLFVTYWNHYKPLTLSFYLFKDSSYVSSNSRNDIFHLIFRRLVYSEVLQRAKKGRNNLHTFVRKANRFGHILRRNCLLKHVIERKRERKIQGSGRRERRRNQLLDDVKKTRRYEKLEEESLDRSL